MNAAETVREITRILNERRPDYPNHAEPERILMHLTLGMLDMRAELSNGRERRILQDALESILNLARDNIPDLHKTPANTGPNEGRK